MAKENDILKFISDTAGHFKDIEKIVLFGSRARKNNGERADFDLLVYADEISPSDWAAFSLKMEEKAPTLAKIDLTLWRENLDSYFLKKIDAEGKVIYERKAVKP